MARPRLQTKKGKPVREWNVPAAELKLLLRAKRPKPGRVRTKTLRVKKADLRISPNVFARPHLLVPERWWRFYFCCPRLRIRKNQKNLTPIEWQRFIHAIEALAEAGMPSPTFAEFVQIHIDAMDTPMGHMWGAHGGQNFLLWHREYLAKLEARLMASLASAAQMTALLAGTDLAVFQNTLEAAPFHNRLHNLVSGTMGTSASPSDPVFWLHHAFIDKTWADWQALHPGVNPPNPGDTLEPAPIMTRTVSQVLDTQSLGYVYA